MTNLRVAVLGAGGRMGQTVCAAVQGDPELDLVAAVDPHNAGLDLRQVAGIDADVIISNDLGFLKADEVDVAIDFTDASAARTNLVWCADKGIHVVVGTSGLSESDLAWARTVFTRSGCLVAPNFAIGAVLMMYMAELAAPWFDTGEIVEMHHNQKMDAPSGTALSTAERMVAASADWDDDPTTTLNLDGSRGATVGGVVVHSIRSRGAMAHQEVVLGTTGQTLTIRHDSYDRDSFMPGVLLATKRVPELIGVTVGLDSLLGLVPLR